VPFFLKSEILNFLEPSGLVQGCTEIALPIIDRNVKFHYELTLPEATVAQFVMLLFETKKGSISCRVERLLSISVL